MPNDYQPGQRWVSESEPELGMGSVTAVTHRTVRLSFAASNETREYARDNAPLRRVRFRVGDTIKTSGGEECVVRQVADRAGLTFYHDGRSEIPESDLNALMSVDKPEERLPAGQVDPPEMFNLRFNALKQQHRRRKSRVRGFVGGRIDLIPHQLYIASEVSARLVPRVLLADEVGLGKTIEACLILHRLILTGRAQRVLILVPDSLVHQWFVELLRRFNLWFHIFDEERCESIENGEQGMNPFLDDQLVLCSLSLLTGSEKRLQQSLAAGWDILVVDEAHHLGWSEESVSEGYRAVEALGRQTPGLLLLTATPEQLGMTSHFARLRLLDPDRFYDREEFIKEADHYRDVARLAEQILAKQELNPAQMEALTGILGLNQETLAFKLEAAKSNEPAIRDELISALLDRHGTGRVMFRNTRATISGFPKRVPHLYRLSKDLAETRFNALAEEFASDTTGDRVVAFEPEFTEDPRLEWLAGMMRALGEEKVLLICRTQLKVAAIETALRQRLNIKIAVFHEGLSLVQRDRNAAWFAEEDGARLLICSEIGSEGRNFQFAHHLVLFDLPLDPELLEQRIGRLDRIGQKAEIQLHVPFVGGSSQEVLARWFHEGLDSFQKYQHGGRELLEQFEGRLRDLGQDFHETHETSAAALDQLIEETKIARQELTLRLEQGRDRLLELNSFRPEVARAVVHDIQQRDEDISLDEFLISVLDQYTIHVEEVGPRSYRLGSAGVFADVFPGLPAQGFTVTCDRRRALSREEVQFLTWDHPLVTGAMDLLLGSGKGNSSFGHWVDKASGLYLEAIFLLECIAPPPLHVDRFLPPTPIRILVNHEGKDVAQLIPPDMLAGLLRKGDPYALLDRREVRDELLPALIAKARALAAIAAAPLVSQGRSEMHDQLSLELSRLQELKKVNRSVRPEEIDLIRQQQASLDQYLKDARLRLDALRFIQRGPR